MSNVQKKKFDWQSLCWDSWCIFSLIGIWPRYIEPQWLMQRSLSIPIPNLEKDLEGLTILQLSDLHWHAHYSTCYQKKILNRVNRLKPDLIVFTGDFLSRSQLEEPEKLLSFLSSFHAPLGCYAILGNHDYDSFVTINNNGDYDVDQTDSQTVLHKGFSRLICSKPKLTKTRSSNALSVKCHPELKNLLKNSSFQLLENETTIIKCKNSSFNLCGLGEFMTGDFLPSNAFEKYRFDLPGIILMHNPDGIASLLEFPGELVLSGHTHGGQINLPWFRSKFTVMEYPELRSGLKTAYNKSLFVNRGLGGLFRFRWFSPPEIALITLTRASHA